MRGAGRKEGDQNTLLAWVKMSHDKLNKIFFFEEWRKGACIRVRLVGSKGLLAFRSRCVSFTQQQQQTGRRVEFYKGNRPKAGA